MQPNVTETMGLEKCGSEISLFRGVISGADETGETLKGVVGYQVIAAYMCKLLKTRCM
jgi:hypothetical protein